MVVPIIYCSANQFFGYLYAVYITGNLHSIFPCRFINSEEKNAEERQQLLISSLHNFSQSILDYTYYHECALANTEFTDDSSLEELSGIIHTLSLPAQLCDPAGGLVRVLGTELLECLYWRVGAMLYMYCYSVYETPARREHMDTERFLKVRKYIVK